MTVTFLWPQRLIMGKNRGVFSPYFSLKAAKFPHPTAQLAGIPLWTLSSLLAGLLELLSLPIVELLVESLSALLNWGGENNLFQKISHPWSPLTALPTPPRLHLAQIHLCPSVGWLLFFILISGFFLLRWKGKKTCLMIFIWNCTAVQSEEKKKKRKRDSCCHGDGSFLLQCGEKKK